MQEIRTRKQSERASPCQGSMPKKARAAALSPEEEQDAALNRPIAPDSGDELHVREDNFYRLLRGIWLCGHSYSEMAMWDALAADSGDEAHDDWDVAAGSADEVPTGTPHNRRTEFVFAGNFYCSCSASKVRRMRQAQRRNREAAELLGFDLPEATLELQPGYLEIQTNSNPDARLYSRSRWCHRALMYLSDSFYLRMVVAQWKENAFGFGK